MSERGTEGKTEAEAGGMEGQKGGRVCVYVIWCSIEMLNQSWKMKKERRNPSMKGEGATGKERGDGDEMRKSDGSQEQQQESERRVTA